MSSSMRPYASLAPNSEQQAFIVALAETGSPEVAEQLVVEALETLGNTLPPTNEEINCRFFLLLTSALIDRQWHLQAWAQRLKGLRGEPRPPPTAVWAELAGTPAGLRRAYLLRRLTNLSASQVASILELSPERVRHPLWQSSRAPVAWETRRYRRQLRALARATNQLQQALTPSRAQRLRHARRQTLESPTDNEHRVLYLWQEALKRQFLPTGVATLLLVVILLVGWTLYF